MRKWINILVQTKNLTINTEILLSVFVACLNGVASNRTTLRENIIVRRTALHYHRVAITELGAGAHIVDKLLMGVHFGKEEMIFSSSVLFNKRMILYGLGSNDHCGKPLFFTLDKDLFDKKLEELGDTVCKIISEIEGQGKEVHAVIVPLYFFDVNLIVDLVTFSLEEAQQKVEEHMNDKIELFHDFLEWGEPKNVAYVSSFLLDQFYPIDTKEFEEEMRDFIQSKL